MNRNYRAALAALSCVPLLLAAGCTAGEDPAGETVHPEIGVVERVVEDTGIVVYRDPYSVIPVVSGKILSCTFEEGDAVAAGQTLYVIDSSDLEDQIVQAALSVKRAEEALAQSAAACEDLTVTASAEGNVTELYVHVGDFVSAGTPIAQVVDSANLTLTVPFAKEDAAAMEPGSPALVSFSSYSGQVTGTVERVYDAPTALAGGREGVYVEISFRTPGALTAGTTATAEVGAAACMEAGEVAAATQQSIYTAQSGQVLTLSIDVGSAVTSGQTVMTLKNASLTNAAANAALELESARVNLTQLEAGREDYVLLAPADGIMTSRLSKAGDFAAAASPVATLAEADSMCVQADIDEIYIDRIWPGQEASVTFTTDSGEQRTYAACVRKVDDTGVTSGGVTDYTVELELDGNEGLKAGMNVAVSIVTVRKEGCLRIPAEAVSGNTVQVLRDGTAREVEVTTGAVGDRYIEIVDGLTEEDAVLLPG